MVSAFTRLLHPGFSQSVGHSQQHVSGRSPGPGVGYSATTYLRGICRLRCQLQALWAGRLSSFLDPNYSLEVSLFSCQSYLLQRSVEEP
ncbi:hypothetical protein EXIGLDRAFT_726089 [Exidia glandulosa HHB12029]|uniref:Uncharacterized protein n=1 Tax=Exidia glandulosa HHB12029 TaxID=1314781 RepID=A0A165DVN2_EXIGL|nr:hypothetical protein EXIGLDRAFT_726089 [Exidia glandulosa HHB12029]